MRIMGYEINEDGCGSLHCYVNPKEGGKHHPCVCVPKGDVALRKKIITRLQHYVYADDADGFKQANPEAAWCGTCPVCGNSTWYSPVGQVCDTPMCSHTKAMTAST